MEGETVSTDLPEEVEVQRAKTACTGEGREREQLVQSPWGRTKG